MAGQFFKPRFGPASERSCRWFMLCAVGVVGSHSYAAGAPGAPTTAPADSTAPDRAAWTRVAATEVLTLSAEPKWLQGGRSEVVILHHFDADQIPAALALRTDSDAITSVADAGPSVNVAVQKISKGLGIRSQIPAACFWIENGDLNFQWLGRDPETIAEKSLVEALLLATDDRGQVIDAFQFVKPVVSQLRVDQLLPLKLPLKSALMKRVDIKAADLPDGWRIAASADPQTIVVTNGDARVRIGVDPNHSAIALIRGSSASQQGAQHRLTVIENRISVLTNESVALEQKTIDYSDEGARAEKERAERENAEKIRALQDAESNATDEVQRISAVAAMELSLSGSVRLVLPNSVCVGEVQLMPSPAAPDGAIPNPPNQ